MSDIVTFTVWDAGYVCISIAILELCSGLFLTQKQFDPFKSYFGDLLSTFGPVLNLGQIILQDLPE